MIRPTQRIWSAVLGVGVAAAGIAGPVVAAPVLAASGAEPVDLTELCVRVRPAFVFIGGGSGVIVRPDGLMLTNDHVIGRKRSFTVRIGDGRSFKAKVLGTDPVGDLAVLKLEVPEGQTVPHLELGDSTVLCVGDEALAIGNPFALDWPPKVRPRGSRLDHGARSSPLRC